MADTTDDTPVSTANVSTYPAPDVQDVTQFDKATCIKYLKMRLGEDKLAGIEDQTVDALRGWCEMMKERYNCLLGSLTGDRVSTFAEEMLFREKSKSDKKELTRYEALMAKVQGIKKVRFVEDREERKDRVGADEIDNIEIGINKYLPLALEGTEARFKARYDAAYKAYVDENAAYLAEKEKNPDNFNKNAPKMNFVQVVHAERSEAVARINDVKAYIIQGLDRNLEDYCQLRCECIEAVLKQSGQPPSDDKVAKKIEIAELLGDLLEMQDGWLSKLVAARQAGTRSRFGYLIKLPNDLGEEFKIILNQHKQYWDLVEAVDENAFKKRVKRNYDARVRLLEAVKKLDKSALVGSNTIRIKTKYPDTWNYYLRDIDSIVVPSDDTKGKKKNEKIKIKKKKKKSNVCYTMYAHNNEQTYSQFWMVPKNSASCWNYQ